MLAKPLIALLLCQLLSWSLCAQSSCYAPLRKEGLALLQKKDYRKAIDKLFAARYCPDKPAKDDLDALIKKTQDAWVKALDDAKADAEDLRDQAEQALNRATQEKNRAEAAEQQARLLASKADTLLFYLQGDSTYATYLKSGKDKFRNGKYQEAIYDFAIAKFTQETDSTTYWIKASQQALEAIKVVKRGYWDKAYAMFDQLPEIDSFDHKNYWKGNIQGSKLEWQNALASQDYKDKHLFTLRYAVSIPHEIGQLIAVEYLQLNGLDLTELSPEIGMLKNLKTIDLARNRLTALPLEFCNLTQLEILYLNGNRLTKVPAEMGNLKQLKSLYLNSNLLTQLPPEMANLIQLKHLSLQGNQLHQMSKTDWNFLKELKVLEALHLYGNKLSPDIIDYIRTLVPADCDVLGDI